MRHSNDRYAERATEMARRIRTGTVGIHCSRANSGPPLGGIKARGIGREIGADLLEYPLAEVGLPPLGRRSGGA